MLQLISELSAPELLQMLGHLFTVNELEEQTKEDTLKVSMGCIENT